VSSEFIEDDDEFPEAAEPYVWEPPWWAASLEPEPAPDPNNPYRSSHPKVYTPGPWKNELGPEGSVASLKERLEELDIFHVYEEVRGFWTQPPAQMKKGKTAPRIDFVLRPKKALLRKGWRLGDVGIECKKSGVGVGKVIDQTLKYRRCLFTLERKGEDGELLPSSMLNYGQNVLLNTVWIWPCPALGGDLGSLSTQNRIGAMVPGVDGSIKVVYNVRCLMRLEANGQWNFNVKNQENVLVTGLSGPCH